MSKKISIYNATYGRLNEIDRSDFERNKMFSRGQDMFDAMESSDGDKDEESIFRQASELAMEQAEYDAQLEGFANIDAYASSPLHYNLKKMFDANGNVFSPGEQLIARLTKEFEGMIRRGEL